MKQLRVICDSCGKEQAGPTWPEGWYHWHQQDLCHECAVPVIVKALGSCSDEWPVPLHATGLFE